MSREQEQKGFVIRKRHFSASKLVKRGDQKPDWGGQRIYRQHHRERASERMGGNAGGEEGGFTGDRPALKAQKVRTGEASEDISK